MRLPSNCTFLMREKKSPSIEIPVGIISLYAQILGPKDTKTLKMVLDTGASRTMVPTRKAMEIGCDPTVSPNRIQIFTASGIEYVPIVCVPLFKCLGMEVKNLEVICHDLPPQSPADGLLGLDFLRCLPPFIEFYQKITSIRC